MELKEKILQFLRDNPSPEDEAVHAFAESLGIEPHELEDEIYDILSGFIAEGIAGGLAEGVDDDEFDAEQLARGILVELEHTDSFSKAKEIAKDHLVESEDYYVALEQMEEELEHKSHSNFYDRMKIITGQLSITLGFRNGKETIAPDIVEELKFMPGYTNIIDDPGFVPIYFKEKIVGGLVAYREYDGIVIESIYVIDDMKNKGIGREAVKEAFNYYGVDTIYGESTEDAKDFWTYLGAEFTDPEAYEEFGPADFILKKIGQSEVKIDYAGGKYKLHPEFDEYIETGADIHADTFLPIIYKNQVVGGMNAEPIGPVLVLYFIATVPAMGGKGIAREAVKQLFEKYPMTEYITGDAVASAKNFWKQLGAEFDNSVFTLKRDAKKPVQELLEKEYIYGGIVVPHGVIMQDLQDKGLGAEEITMYMGGLDRNTKRPDYAEELELLKSQGMVANTLEELRKITGSKIKVHVLD